jgi:DNA-binding NarL/FixJ family response regulator
MREPSVHHAPPPRVLLADDHLGILRAVRRTLQGSCEVVGEVNSGREVVEAVERLRPDVLVLDISLPDVNGLDLCTQVKTTNPETKVVVLTAMDNADISAEALQLGASAVVLKNWMARDLVRCVQAPVTRDVGESGPERR